MLETVLGTPPLLVVVFANRELENHACALMEERKCVWLTRLDRWSVGSMMFLASWAFLMGPYQYATHLLSGPRLPFTAAYFGSIIMTIYFAVGVRFHHVRRRRFRPHADFTELAPFDNPHPIIVHCATTGLGVVSGQLFPNGQHRLAFRC